MFVGIDKVDRAPDTAAAPGRAACPIPQSMNLSISRAAALRIAPFAVFMLLLAARGAAPDEGFWNFDQRWLYAVTVVCVGSLLWAFRHEYRELFVRPSRAEALIALSVGMAVFALWVQLDAPWMRLGTATAAFRPVDDQGRLLWPLVAVRSIGAALVVPLMEELFWRSFVMRWIERQGFESVDPQHVGTRAIVLSTFLFTLAHTLWLAAVIAGLAYAWLYVRTGRLWVPIIAHAVTNVALAIWVVATGSWAFW